MTIKISVVVTTHNTDLEQVDALVSSIDDQTMSAGEMEIIFVDDGSTSQVYEKLLELERARPNVKATRIENSGWASRPRNVGIEMARGEYILFMDHDDVVFPLAFESSYQFGVANNADVVNPKEVRTKSWGWGLTDFSKTEADATGVQALLPMTPHKFYRREFLLEHEIKFEEGGRVLFEDVLFNTAVYAKNARVAVFADTACYEWVHTENSLSSTFLRDPHELWRNTRRVLEHFRSELTPGEDLDFLLAHWFRTKFLARFGPLVQNDSASDLQTSFDLAHSVARDLIPVELDGRLPLLDQARAHLFRTTDLESLVALAQQDSLGDAKTHIDSAAWVNGKLVLELSTVYGELNSATGSPSLFRRHNGTVVRNLPQELASRLPDDLLSVEQALLSATFELGARGRWNHVSWKFSGDQSLELVAGADGSVTLRARLRGSLDPGSRLHADGIWDVSTILTVLGRNVRRGISDPRFLAQTDLSNNRLSVAYRSRSDTLAIDLASRVKAFMDSARPRQKDLSWKKRGKHLHILLRLPNTTSGAASDVLGLVELVPWHRHVPDTRAPVMTGTAHLLAAKGVVRIAAKCAMPVAGRYRFQTILQGRRSTSKLYIDIP